MVTITARMDDLEQLYGRKMPRNREHLNELLYSVKCELSGSIQTDPILDETELQLENKDSNRPDIWSPEGIARALRGIQRIETGLKKYSVSKKPAVEISVDKELRDIRPYIACAVALHPKIDDTIIRSLVHLQEKLDQSYGRRRRRSSIGFYDFDLIEPPLRYGAANPDEIKFVPLDTSTTLSLREILTQHPKGIEYGTIVSGFHKYPILLDSKDQVLSFPPIINSNDLGKVTPETRNLLVEITGTSEETVKNALISLTVALSDRGAEIHPARIHYPYPETHVVTTPELKERRINLPIESIKTLTGLDLSRAELTSLLRRARYDVASATSKSVKVLVPCYRFDILHPVDIIEDIAIAYGLNNVKPRWPEDATIGSLSQIEEFSDTVRELMLGLGFQEILTFAMTNLEKLFTKMNHEPTQIVEIANPKITTMTCLRSWLLPSLMDFLSSNTHVEYPQRVYEVGYCTLWDMSLPNRTRDNLRLACASAHARANFTEIKSNLEPLMINLGLEFTIKPTENPSFLSGRAGTICVGDHEVGIIGEVHPQVLENWNLEDPVAAMELDLDTIFGVRGYGFAGEAPKPPTSERAN